MSSYSRRFCSALLLAAAVDVYACSALATTRLHAIRRWSTPLCRCAARCAARGCLPDASMSIVDVEEIAVRQQLYDTAVRVSLSLRSL